MIFNDLYGKFLVPNFNVTNKIHKDKIRGEAAKLFIKLNQTHTSIDISIILHHRFAFEIPPAIRIRVHCEHRI